VANNWQEDELLLTLHLYCRTAFGKLHQTNPEIIKLADIIGRTPSAVAINVNSSDSTLQRV
jgi:putative restriction endonuclease